MPEGPPQQSRVQKPIAAFVAGAITATCLVLAVQWVAGALDSLASSRGPYERVTWDHTMAEPPPDDFLFAMFPATESEVPGRVMLNTFAEVASGEGYALFDPLNPGYIVPRDQVAFTAPLDELHRYVKAFNDAVKSWGDDYRDGEIQIDARTTESQLVVILELRFDEGKLERYEYELVDGGAVPLVFTEGLWKYVVNY